VYATVHACARKRHILLCEIMHSQSVFPWYPAAKLLRQSNKKTIKKASTNTFDPPLHLAILRLTNGSRPFRVATKHWDRSSRDGGRGWRKDAAKKEKKKKRPQTPVTL
jgi:hypothetical protein